MPDRHRITRSHRPLSVVGDDQLPDVQVAAVGTVSMSDEQYTAAIHAVAALITNWHATRADEPTGDRDAHDRGLAA